MQAYLRAVRTESLAACIAVAVALPSGAQGQATAAVTDRVADIASVVAPERSPRLGDALAEAYRSPFHGAARASSLATSGDEADVTRVRIPLSGGLVPDSADESTPFIDIFIPTLATAFVLDLGAAFLVGACVYAVCESKAEAYTVLLLGASAAALGTAAVARSFGKGTRKNSILGSMIGIGAGVAPFALGMDDDFFWAAPIIQALVTTVFARS